MVKAEHHENGILFTVQDNGIGFDPEQPSNRNGLKNHRARANRIKGDLQIFSEPGKGTLITLLLKSGKLKPLK